MVAAEVDGTEHVRGIGTLASTKTVVVEWVVDSAYEAAAGYQAAIMLVWGDLEGGSRNVGAGGGGRRLNDSVIRVNIVGINGSASRMPEVVILESCVPRWTDGHQLLKFDCVAKHGIEHSTRPLISLFPCLWAIMVCRDVEEVMCSDDPYYFGRQLVPGTGVFAFVGNFCGHGGAH